MGVNQYKMSKLTLFIFSAAAFILVSFFAYWWFNPAHIPDNFHGWAKILDVILFILVSYVVWHPIIMEVLTWLIASHIKDTRKQKPLPGLKVAFITTIVPQNEPVELLHKCLPAMVKAKYKHDTWVLDEGNSEEVKKICRQYGVKHFSRHGKKEYNTKIGKFTKTKGGNHNSWYDVHADKYDIVAQIDTDFVPRSNFLTKTLGYFRYPDVAFVGTPQIYGNAHQSFVALGSSEQQFSFYGAVLRGLNSMGMTLLIGANHVIRVAAFKKVDYYTAHITEDLITGIKLHANGWKSIYVPYTLAIGEGPSTWESYFNQQLRWAYGCIDILFKHTPRQFLKLGLRQTIYYFFLQQHYFSGLIMAFSLILLSLYFAFGIRSADVDTVKFFTLYTFTLIICWLMSIWLQRYDIYKRKGGALLLAGKIISIAAWPIWFLGFINVIFGKRLIYKVTPKGENDQQVQTSVSTFIPHFLFAGIAVIGLVSALFTHRQNPVMLFWALSSTVMMLVLPFVNQIFKTLRKIKTFIHIFFQKQFKKTPKDFLSPLQSKELIIDCLFLSLIVVFSYILYITKIGFYSDDWSFLGNFTLSHDKSIFGLRPFK